MKYLIVSLMLLFLNLLYSAYALKTSKEYAQKLSELRSQSERYLKLKAEIDGKVNYSTAKDYAKDDAFVPVDWSRISILKETK
jgi:pentose-5-phosphate-3-epimerase